MENAQRVEMIAVCDTLGHLRPLRFRYEGRDRQLYRADVSRILETREIAFAGIDAIRYVCSAQCEGKERIFELRYHIRSHDWHMVRSAYLSP